MTLEKDHTGGSPQQRQEQNDQILPAQESQCEVYELAHSTLPGSLRPWKFDHRLCAATL